MEVKEFFRLLEALKQANEYKQYKSDIRGDLYLFELELKKQTKQIIKLVKALIIVMLVFIIVLVATQGLIH